MDEEDVVLPLMQEDSVVYNIKHRAYYFAKEVVLFVGKQKYDRIYFSLFDQLVRSVTSIGANLVEGMAGSSKNDFLKFNIIALKSANESKYWLCLIRDTMEINKSVLEKFIKEADEVSKIIASIVINTKK
ncbi:four helix bundle protein [Segetibacter aerophilus]|uniref:Four helix bundle protein n=1 Tax=Segetibacter aerophilus TaxID=670293 RepID=A0A512BB75_9BACT|nr:four helix bundle protein [Segetibacter aerophilus]GEO09180.1 four helix bundle protein [Segetibacter aerophilus]